MPKHNFALYCKSFRDDFDRLKVLFDSLANNNINVPFMLSVPADDIKLLTSTVIIPWFVEVYADEAYVIEGSPFSYGWLQQQVCKLSVYRSDFAKSYAMIDSDTYFVKGADTLADHCATNSIVCSEIHTKYGENNVALAKYIKGEYVSKHIGEPYGILEGSDRKLKDLKIKANELEKINPLHRGNIINEVFGVSNFAFQPSQYFHSFILSDFAEFLKSLRMDFYDCIRIAPWEYNWYACYALAKWSTMISCVCSPVLHFASTADIIHAKSVGIGLTDIKARFCAIQMAARHFEQHTFA